MAWRRVACLAATMLAVSTVARAEHLVLQTPPDWAVTTLPAPDVDGHPLDGGRRRAILSGTDGHPLAAIELTELPQASDHTGQLPTMLQQAVAAATKQYAGNHLEDRCDAPVTLEIAGQPALRTDCTVFRGAQPVLGQVIVMLVTPAGLYSVSYSAGMAGFRTHLPVLGQALASARLQ